MPSTITDSTRTCPFCGRVLHARTLRLMGREVFGGFEECGCPGAIADRARQRSEEVRRDEAERQRAIDESAKMAGVQQRYIHAMHPRADEVAEAVSKGMNVYICGDVGSTKTTLASAAVLELLGTRSVRMTSVVAMLDSIKAGFKDDYDPLPVYERAAVLVLDDLGKGQQTPYTLERLFVLMDYRSGNLLPTIVTTQYQPGKLIARMASQGDEETAKAIVSRLRQDCLTIRLTGPDRRTS